MEDEEEEKEESNPEEKDVFQGTERKGTFVGTINYLAPEMINNSSASMATDIWALGCIFFKMLTGSVPFTGTNTIKVF